MKVYTTIVLAAVAMQVVLGGNGSGVSFQGVDADAKNNVAYMQNRGGNSNAYPDTPQPTPAQMNPMAEQGSHSETSGTPVPVETSTTPGMPETDVSTPLTDQNPTGENSPCPTLGYNYSSTGTPTTPTTPTTPGTPVPVETPTTSGMPETDVSTPLTDQNPTGENSPCPTLGYNYSSTGTPTTPTTPGTPTDKDGNDSGSNPLTDKDGNGSTTPGPTPRLESTNSTPNKPTDENAVTSLSTLGGANTDNALAMYSKADEYTQNPKQSSRFLRA